MLRLSRYILAPALGVLMAGTAVAQTTTDVGTPRSETLVVQTFDNRSPNPTAMNPLNQYAVWRGFRELGWGYLWEMDTATGESYPEMADGFPEVLNDDHTHFRIKIRPGIYWSDGEELTVDDFIFTLETSFKYRDQLTNVSTATSLIKEGSWKKIDDYTFELETVETAYDLVTRLGVYTWGTGFNVVPEHVFGPLGDAVTTFENIDPVTLGPYTMHSFDPNGFSYGFMGEPAPKYILYKGFGPEETRVLAFVQNQYDMDTFMSPDSIKAAQARNEHIETFAPTFPFHDMGDACSFGVRFHQQKEPYNLPEVRWALALTMDLEQVGLSALSGEFVATALPVADQPITREIYYKPLEEWLTNFAFEDGYQPFDPDFNINLAQRLLDEGADPALVPQGEEAIKNAFGAGWFKHDPAKAEELLASVGIKKGADGMYDMPDGSDWVMEFVYPGDWHPVLQRLGLSISDSWRQAGFNVNARQVDSGEFGTYWGTNSVFQTILHWQETCIFESNWLRNWRVLSSEYVMEPDSTDRIVGNYLRVKDDRIFDLVAKGIELPLDSEERLGYGLEVMKIMVEDMMVLPVMSIPTTIPTNNYYWTNFTKADNFYALPYSWWSSFKKQVVNIEPTGNT
jgi:peptide/nickel transport system substrate-binding protein